MSIFDTFDNIMDNLLLPTPSLAERQIIQEIATWVDANPSGPTGPYSDWHIPSPHGEVFFPAEDFCTLTTKDGTSYEWTNGALLFPLTLACRRRSRKLKNNKQAKLQSLLTRKE